MKNLITNIFGVLIWITAIINAISKDKNILFISLMILFGGILFRFENKKLIALFNKAINLILTYKFKK